MLRTTIAVMVASLLACVVAGEEPGDELKPKRTGRPGQLSLEEEARIDRIIDRFILYDIGRIRDPQALRDFNALGHEAIPGLIRGMNKAARMHHSCPAGTIYRKLRRLLRTSDDPRTLMFARDNIGAGVGQTRYAGLLRNLKLVAAMRQSQLARQQRYRQRQYYKDSKASSPGERNRNRQGSRRP